MNIFKLLVALVVIFLAAFGAFALLGLLFATLKYVLVLGLVVLAAGLGTGRSRKSRTTRSSARAGPTGGWKKRSACSKESGAAS